jgi:mono/diheme cytochrome c family protein
MGLRLAAGVLALAGQAVELHGEGGGALGLGRPAEEAEVRAWDIEISPFGDGLPAGGGTAKQGAKVFAAKCASCHGKKGIEGPAPRLVGGIGTLASAEPVKTVGSYWPYATTLYDYVYRSMPPAAPQSLKPDDVYAVVAWVLAENGIIREEQVMDAATLPKVEMPNRKGFIPDPRPDVPAK